MGKRIFLILPLIASALLASCSPAGQAPASDYVMWIDVPPDGHASGFAVSSTQLVTNHHVSLGKGKDVVDTAGEVRSTTVVLTDADLDLALLEIEADEPPFPSFASLRCERPSAGEEVYATGHPLATKWATFWGRVASDFPPFFPPSSGIMGDHLVVLDMGINRGISGAPVHDALGLVVGVIHGALTERSAYGDGIPGQSGLMISGDVLCGFLDAI